MKDMVERTFEAELAVECGVGQVFNVVDGSCYVQGSVSA